MAEVEAQVAPGQTRDVVTWGPITENDTPMTRKVLGGKYSITVEGTWGGMSLEMKYGKEDGNEESVDDVNLTFTANKTYNVEIGTGHWLPVITGGSSASVKVTMEPIP